ncbi:MAG: hypothetical protein HYW05_04735 [Candidatus Diapherotrites archaeon]|nr:hypothetical protein [Candidatus Diapherotrites archaeon]
MEELSALSEPTPYERIASVYYAKKAGLPIKHGYWIKADEINPENISKIGEKFKGHLSLHQIFDDKEQRYLRGVKGMWLHSFDSKRIMDAWNEVKEHAAGIVLDSTETEFIGKEYYMAAGTALDDRKVYFEVVIKKSPNELYSEGKCDLSFILSKDDAPQKEIRGINAKPLYDNLASLIEFSKAYGECVTELMVIEDKFFFLEAKKGKYHIEIGSITIISKGEEVSGTCGRAGEAEIILAEAPQIELTPLVSSAKGFIFRKGALLAHFAVILRERRMPAFIVGNLIDSLEGKRVVMKQSEPYLLVKK